MIYCYFRCLIDMSDTYKNLGCDDMDCAFKKAESGEIALTESRTYLQYQIRNRFTNQ